MKSIIGALLGRKRTAKIFEGGPQRPLRNFDIEVVAPYDNKALVAFMKADKLAKLTKTEIVLFLLLNDTPKAEIRTESWIAEHLEMPLGRVRSGLNGLKRKGYAMHGPVQEHACAANRDTAWVCDPDNWWTDDDFLYWEFGMLH
jgi:hypothetical protein